MTWLSMDMKKSPRINKNFSWTNKWVQQGHSTQDQHTQINCGCIYYQWTHEHWKNTVHDHTKMKYLSVNLTKPGQNSCADYYT